MPVPVKNDMSTRLLITELFLRKNTNTTPNVHQWRIYIFNAVEYDATITRGKCDIQC